MHETGDLHTKACLLDPGLAHTLARYEIDDWTPGTLKVSQHVTCSDEVLSAELQLDSAEASMSSD